MRFIGFLVFFFLLLSTLVFEGCKNRYRQQDSMGSNSLHDQESMLKSNQLMIKKYSKQISDEAVAKGWKLKETGTGVFYQVLTLAKTNNNRKIVSGDKVTLTYSLSLLNGKVCYTSRDNGPKQFVVEKSEAESGLHEAIQFMHNGDSALIVIPPQWAFGLTGDGNCIPSFAILVYNIRIDSVDSNH
jgi:FKBP-type peptidyl-prolyl cis-trans isomerase